MKKTTRLKKLLAEKRLLVAPAAYDALSARIIEQAGFELMAVTGYGLSASLLGRPDVGLTTMTEVVTASRNIAAAVEVPVFADADTGYGNAINVMRAIEEFIRAGVAGVHLEDQVSPKRCGHVAGKQLISIEEAAGKIRAAAKVRKELDPDFVLIARTDARGALGGGMDEVIRRGRAYVEAGADVVFPDGLTAVEELERCVREVPAPILYNMVGVSPLLPFEELEALGVAVVEHAGGAFLAAARAMLDFMHGFKAGGTQFLVEFGQGLAQHPMRNFHRFIGFDRIRQLEEEYLPSEEVQRKYAETVGYQP